MSDSSASSGDILRLDGPDDLGLPLRKALEAARAAERPLRIRIAPGEWTRGTLNVKDTGSRSTLEVIVEGEGDTPVELRGMTVDLAAAKVTLRNVVVRGASSTAPALSVRVAESLHLERVAVIDAARTDAQLPDPVVRFAAGFRGTNVRGVLEDCAFIGNRVEGHAPLIEVESRGRSRFSELRLRGTTFADNQAAVGISPQFTERVTVADGVVFETRLADGWLMVQSPKVHVEFDGGVVATTSPAVYQRTSADVAAEDFPPVQVHGTRWHAPSPPTLSSVSFNDTRPAAPPGGDAPRKALEEAASRGLRATLERVESALP